MFLRCWATIVFFIFSSVALGKNIQGIEQAPATWYQLDSSVSFSAINKLENYHEHKVGLIPAEGFNLMGGYQASILAFSLSKTRDVVVDFRNSTLIGEFQHFLFTQGSENTEAKLVAVLQGGLSVPESGSFFLRNGKTLELEQGRYRLITYQNSQFNIAPPTPFVMDKMDYIADIRLGNAISLGGIGIFFSLFIYYIVLSVSRASLVDFSYAIFILGNLLFNSTSLLVASDLFGITWFGGASWPILFSNIAYIIFVMSLLNVTKHRTPVLWYFGVGILSVFVLFILFSIFLPELQNEFNRFAVGVFMAYGLAAGLTMVFKGSMTARLYLLANIGFVTLGGIAITQEQIAGLQTIYMSHIGLIAVACEVILLSCLLAYKMTRVEGEKSYALQKAKEMLKIAHTDQLTQLPNRYAMEKQLFETNGNEFFIYIDLDGLKMCNDTHGHDMGDRLLLSFSTQLAQTIPNESRLFRISGDEFGIIAPSKQYQTTIQALNSVDQSLKREFGDLVGVSFGGAKFEDYSECQAAVQAADQAMYVNKKRKKVLSA